MKRAVVHGPGDLRLDDILHPTVGPNDIVLKVASAGICGSDFSYLRAGGAGARAERPFGLGHEFAGEITDIGRDVRSFRLGERVAYNSFNSPADVGRGSPEGGFSDYLLLKNIDDHPQTLERVPLSVSMDHAALVEPLSVALHSIHRADPKPGERIAVFGVGPIGLGMILCLRQNGIDDIIAFDLSPLRRQRALDLGARAAFDPREHAPAQILGDFRGYGTLRGQQYPLTEVYLESTGAPGLLSEIVDFCHLGSRIVTVAMQKAPITLPASALLAKELSLMGSLGYPSEFPEVMELLAAGAFDPELVISDRFEFNSFLDAFEHASNPETSSKVLIKFGN